MMRREDSQVKCSRFCVGDVSVQLVGGSDVGANMGAVLDPFRTEAGPSDIEIQVEWVPSLDLSSKRFAFDSGTTWRVCERAETLEFDFHAAVFGKRPLKRLLIDKRFSQASLRMNAECFDGTEFVADPLAYPLDELLIMHRLTQERGIELHSSGIVGPNGASNLFVGHSGAGKSTTTRLWTAHEGVEVLSDDRIIVREQAGQMVMYGTPWHGEAAFASPGSAPLKRIFILEQGDRKSTRLNSSHRH